MAKSSFSPRALVHEASPGPGLLQLARPLLPPSSR